MHSDLELLRLERALHEARHRLAWVRRLVPDATVRRVAEDLCAEAAAASYLFQGSRLSAQDPLHSRETMTLVRAYSAIHNPRSGRVSQRRSGQLLPCRTDVVEDERKSRLQELI